MNALQTLASNMYFGADLEHEWTEGSAVCALCGASEYNHQESDCCEVQVQALMLRFAEEANRRKLLEFV